MYINHQKEQFSVAFIHAVASVAGYKIARCEVDDDSVDVEILGSRSQGTVRRAPRLDVQAKCTEIDAAPGESLSYPLPLKNYDDLRDVQVHVPRILVVVTVPVEVMHWLSCSSEEMVLRRCGLWTSLRGAADAEVTTKKSVRLSRSQPFNVESLRAIMDRIGSGGFP